MSDTPKEPKTAPKKPAKDAEVSLSDKQRLLPSGSVYTAN